MLEVIEVISRILQKYTPYQDMSLPEKVEKNEFGNKYYVEVTDEEGETKEIFFVIDSYTIRVMGAEMHLDREKI